MSSISPATGSVTKSPAVDDTLGAILIGALLSMGLWGVGCTQAYDYFILDGRTDGRLQRWIVVLLWILDTLFSAMTSHMVYFFFITNYTDAFAQSTPWSLNFQSLVAGVSNFIIRIMFTRRIYQFGQKNKIVPAWIVIMSICDLVVAIVRSAAASSVYTPRVLENLTKLMYISTVFGVTADLSVTIALCWLLQSAKSGFRRTDSIVNVLIVYVVNTGLLVTIFATLGLITYVVMPGTLVFLAFFILANKLYVNAYFASLNARARLRGKRSDTGNPLTGPDISSSQHRDAQGIPSDTPEKRASHFHKPALAISFQTTVERRVDDLAGEVKFAHAV